MEKPECSIGGSVAAVTEFWSGTPWVWGGFMPLAEAKQHGWDRQLKHLQPSAPANTTTAH